MSKQKENGIGWCDYTFNPWIGCTKVSPACDNCYAQGIAKRFFPDAKWGNHQRVLTSEANWKKPLAWNRQAEKEGQRLKVFCGSMCDVFDNKANPYTFAKLLLLVWETPYLDWLFLTKRIGNAHKLLRWASDRIFAEEVVLENLWLGITVCNQEEADRDIPKLLQIPAAKRFLSIEPMLGAVDLDRYLGCGDPLCECGDRGVDWVIVGGETGHKARPMWPEWARSIRDQCQGAGVPYFFKQWGEFLWCDTPPKPRWKWHTDQSPKPMPNSAGLYQVGKKKAGCLLDGREWKEFPSE